MNKNIIKKTKKLNEQVNEMIEDFCARNIQPVVNEICKKHNLVFISGMGTYFFDFHENDPRESIIDIRERTLIDDSPDYWLDSTIEDIRNFPDDGFGFTIEEVESLRPLCHDVWGVLELLREDILAYPVITEFGQLCDDYDVEKEKQETEEKQITQEERNKIISNNHPDACPTCGGNEVYFERFSNEITCTDCGWTIIADTGELIDEGANR